MSLDDDLVLAANRAFYDAFASRDADAMDAVWSDSEAVTCVHPGWQVLRGREAVMDSWRAILAGDSPAMECTQPAAEIVGEVAIVLCIEHAPGSPGELVATNVFHRAEGEWKLMHHHAGLIARSQSSETPPKRTIN